MAVQKELSPAEKFAYQFGYTNESNGSTFGPSIKTDTSAAGYGSSVFHLTTVENDGTVLTLTGILNQMPEISFGVNFTEGPGKSTQDMLATFFENDIFEIVNAAGGDTDKSHSFRNLISTGKLSKDMYGGLSASDINLKFRIYEQDPLGQSPVISWKKALCKYAIPSSENEFSIQNGIQNIISGLLTAEHVGTDLISVFGKQKTAVEIQQENEQHKNSGVQDASSKNMEKNALAAEIHKDIRQYLWDWESSVKTKLRGQTRKTGSMGDYYKDVITNVEIKRCEAPPNLIHSNSYFYGKLIITYTHENIEWNMYKSDTVTKQLILSQKLYWSTTLGSDDSWDSDCIFDENGNVTAKLDEYLSSWQKEVKNEGFDSDSVFSNAIDDFSRLIKEKFVKRHELKQTPLQESAKEVTNTISETQRIINTVSKKVDDIQAIGEARFGNSRVINNFNISNSLGEKLWYLTIYKNFLFKKPLTVAVKDWDIANSKEFVNGHPVYSDISITCTLDQTYSIEQWETLLLDQKIEINKKL